MSMEISNRYGLEFINKGQIEQTAKDAERAEETTKSKEKDKPGIILELNGNMKIIFDTPKKTEEAESEQSKGSKLKGVPDDDRVQVTIGNMDKVKKEIKKLKEEKKQLEQQLKMAAGNEQRTKELETRLAQVEAELSVKDTDEYKKQHAEYTTEE